MAAAPKTVKASAGGPRDSSWAVFRGLPLPDRRRVVGCVSYLLLLMLLFSRLLAELSSYAAHSELHSHVLLIPFISAYLLSLRRGGPEVAFRSSAVGTVMAAAIGVAALMSRLWWSAELSRGDGIALTTLAFVSLVAAGGFLFLGAEWMKGNAFPVGFLIFMIPLPEVAVNWLENASAGASTEVAAFYIRLWGVAFVREGRAFELPGITLQVAQECSGIRSSLILFISSLVASHLFLRTRWRRLVLVAFVIPLGILRNGFRILVIAWLCVNIGPEMIDSPIHHRGGPVFFVLSLAPLFLLLWWLRRQELAGK